MWFWFFSWVKPCKLLRPASMRTGEYYVPLPISCGRTSSTYILRCRAAPGWPLPLKCLILSEPRARVVTVGSRRRKWPNGHAILARSYNLKSYLRLSWRLPNEYVFQVPDNQNYQKDWWILKRLCSSCNACMTGTTPTLNKQQKLQVMCDVTPGAVAQWPRGGGGGGAWRKTLGIMGGGGFSKFTPLFSSSLSSFNVLFSVFIGPTVH